MTRRIVALKVPTLKILIGVMVVLLLGILSWTFYEGLIAPVTCIEPASRYEARTPSPVQITVYERNMVILINQTDRTLAYDRTGSFVTHTGRLEPGESVTVPCGRGKLIEVYEAR